MQLLVTGGQGQLSQRLVSSFVERGHRAHVVGQGQLRHPRVVEHASLADLDVDFRAVDAVVDLQGPAPAQMIQSMDASRYLEDTQFLLRQARSAAVPRFLHIGVSRPARFDHPFIRVKEQQESLIKKAGIPYLILRSPWIVGPQDQMLSPIIDAMAEGAHIDCGDLQDTVIQMVTQSDLAESVLQALDMRIQVSRVYEIASFHTCTLAELLYRLQILVRQSAHSEKIIQLQEIWTESLRSLVRQQPVGTPTAYSLDFRRVLRSVDSGLSELVRQRLFSRRSP